MYSDGLASVSVYIEPIAGARSGETRARRGAVNVHTRFGHGRRIVAIGKVPAATVTYFARPCRACGRQARQHAPERNLSPGRRVEGGNRPIHQP
jgi:hypothetical protein